jgi:hypothetical protein
MRLTHFEACEEDVYRSENKTKKHGKAVSKQLIAGEYRMSQGTMHGLKTTVNIAVKEFVRVTSQYQQLQIAGMKIFWIDS